MFIVFIALHFTIKDMFNKLPDFKIVRFSKIYSPTASDNYEDQNELSVRSVGPHL